MKDLLNSAKKETEEMKKSCSEEKERMAEVIKKMNEVKKSFETQTESSLDKLYEEISTWQTKETTKMDTFRAILSEDLKATLATWQAQEADKVLDAFTTLEEYRSQQN